MFDFLRAIPKKRSVKIKKKSGIIFNNIKGFKKNLFDLGTGVIIFSLFCFIYLYQPLFVSWMKYKQISNNVNKQIIPTVKPLLTPYPTNSPTPPIKKTIKEEIEVKTSEEFSIEIPKIGAISEIIAEVSPIDKSEYLKILQNDKIAHSSFSALPGNGKGSMTYLFAHSTEQSIPTVRKNSIFYFLGELSEGDKILINHLGQKIEYEVYMKKIITAKESEYLTYSDPKKEVLILQTCWPIGTNWKRLLVFASRT